MNHRGRWFGAGRCCDAFAIVHHSLQWLSCAVLIICDNGSRVIMFYHYYYHIDIILFYVEFLS